MGIVSRPRSNPALLRAVARYLRYRSMTEVGEDSLRRTIAPNSFIAPGTREDVGAVEGSMWRDSIDLAVEFRIAERRDGQLAFTEQTVEDLAADDLAIFRRTLRRIVLSPEHNQRLWESSEGGWPSAGAREFSRVAVWFFELHPEPMTNESAYDAAQQSVQGSDKLIENVEQWRIFARWAEALGLISRLEPTWLADPTVAVEEELAEVFGPRDELPALQLRDDLARAIPLLRPGEYVDGLDAFLTEKPTRLDDEAGPALAFALSRLESRGLIDFDRRSDADQLILADPHSSENPTHILLRGSR